MKKYIVFDVDTGVDDSLALMLASASEEIELLAVTTTFGNCAVDTTTYNSLKILDMLGKKVPVAKGAWRPMIDPPFDYKRDVMVDIHGRDGLGNVGTMVSEPVSKAVDMAAADLMGKAIAESPEKVTIVATGPLGNVATFLMTYPELKSKVEQIAIMGGAAYGGNLKFSVEANIGHDPEAAEVVFKSGVPVVMFGLDATMSVFITDEERRTLAENGGEVGNFYKCCLQQYADIYRALANYPGAVLHDSVPVAWLLDESVVELKDAFVEIELNGYGTRGCTVCDFGGMLKKPFNAKVAMAADREKIIGMHLEAVKKFADKKI